jgi:hypothetical protein
LTAKTSTLVRQDFHERSVSSSVEKGGILSIVPKEVMRQKYECKLEGDYVNMDNLRTPESLFGKKLTPQY